ncbi:hypothetical protein K7432_016563 [Basidiobolus ranarum]|uniref:Secreted protein n=1 Tax=Basidiobolus ranarum TaxID=34480 RepID=A0ABR2VLF2_9FUNG
MHVISTPKTKSETSVSKAMIMLKALLSAITLACCAISLADARVNCPNGNGVYCGSVLGLKANSLYDCKSDRWSWSYHPIESCRNGCVVAKAGTPDHCQGADETGDDNKDDNVSFGVPLQKWTMH